MSRLIPSTIDISFRHAFWSPKKKEGIPLIGHLVFRHAAIVAAALVAAANSPNVVEAVVSRGGRSDLAGTNLEFVKAPTLLVVGENDQTMIELMKLNNVKNKKIVIIPRATHLFEEPGTIEQVVSNGSNWFLNYEGNIENHERF